MFNQKFYPHYQDFQSYNDPNMPMANNTNPFGAQQFNPPYDPTALANPFATSDDSMESMPIPASNNYSHGGSVSLPKWAQKIQSQGRNGDTMLAHINPIEAALLKKMGGSGTINPKTGLREYGLLKNPLKWLKGSIGGMAGVILGNMLLPGVGGILGGALGGAAGSAARGRKDYGKAAFRGAGMGAIAPSVASLLGSGLTSAGATGAGATLSNYGNTNAILPALGLGGGAAAGGNTVNSSAAYFDPTKYNAAGITPNLGVSAGMGQQLGGAAPSQSFTDMLMSKSKDFFTSPKNLLSTASLAATALNRPKPLKEKSPEQQADEFKRLERNKLFLTPEQRAEKEAQMLAEEQLKRRIQRDKFLPSERLDLPSPLYTRSNTPEEYRAQGKWLNYYDNPEFTGQPRMYKEGGRIKGDKSPFANPFKQAFVADKTALIPGNGGGQDDNIATELPEDGYILDASVTSGLGDGSPQEGFNKIQAFVSKDETYISPEDVARVGKGDVKKGTKILNKIAKNVRKHKGGSVNLPPKAKEISQYLNK